MSDMKIILSSDVEIDIKPILDEMVDKDCIEEATDIVKNTLSNDDIMEYLDMLSLYVYYLDKDKDKINLYLSNLKVKLVKEGKMIEGGCFSPE